jgi:hypothetical protein
MWLSATVTGGFCAFSLAVDRRSGLNGGRSGDQQFAHLAIMALTLALVGCMGDRIKQGMNSRQGSVVKRVSRSAAWSG